MGILKVIFSAKNEKTKNFETLIHGDFDNNFEKKNENEHFDMISEFINMQIWTIFFHRNRCFDKPQNKNSETKFGYICISVKSTYIFCFILQTKGATAF